MALCPFAVHKLIPPGANDPRINARVAILHVDGGNAESLYNFFDGPSGGIESHFHVRKDGVIEQYRDTEYQADANRYANDFAVSIESQGLAAGEWTPEQMKSIKRLLLWLRDVEDIPLTQVQTWDGAGVGYHTLFGAPSQWTPYVKSCPGEDRKKQFHSELVPWMNTGGEEEEDEMQLNDDVYRDERKMTVRDLFIKLDRFVTNSAKRDKALRAQIAEVQEAVEKNADKAEIRKMLNRVADRLAEDEGATT